MGVPMHPVDVFLLLTSGGKVLLALREGTGYADGTWNLPSGKLETGEDAVSGVIRESAEEIGVRLDPGDLRLVTTVHHRNAEGGSRIGLFFAAEHDSGRHGEPRNAEPHKCAGLDWFPPGALPDPTYRYTRAGVAAFLQGEPLCLDGWA
jgi:8-oxo-dGTP pyrophosphatase MutT (NUDIX family)